MAKRARLRFLPFISTLAVLFHDAAHEATEQQDLTHIDVEPAANRTGTDARLNQGRPTPAQPPMPPHVRADDWQWDEVADDTWWATAMA
jgi:hypothetical protein